MKLRSLVCLFAVSAALLPAATAGWAQEEEVIVIRAGRKFEIKGRRPTPENSSRQLSALRDLDEKPFNFLVGILFDEDFSVRRASSRSLCVMR